MVDDTYYITPHEAALAVVATAMKKSRLPLYILVINSIIGAFLFSAGGMLYVMVESGSQSMLPGWGMFTYMAEGAVYAVGLFYVIVCGMELFNSNILFFSVGVMRGAVTLMDLLISWFVSFWVNLAATVFVVYVFCYCSGVFKQEIYVQGTLAIAASKNSYTFAETLLKGIIGNFFVCLAIYLQIMVKPLHVKLIMIFLPVFTFVAMGFTHSVADMFLVPSGIFNNCGYGFGHYFWKIMLPGTLGNMIGGSFFGIVIPWYLHLCVIEGDMEKLNLPAYEERDEQPMLNMDSRVVRVPTITTPTSSTKTSLKEFKPDIEDSYNDARSTSIHPQLSRISTAASSIKSRRSGRQLRSPKGVFPVYDMGEPLRKEKTIASAYQSSLYENNSNNIDDIVNSAINQEYKPNVNGIHQFPNEDAQSSISGSSNAISRYSGDNQYTPDDDIDNNMGNNSIQKYDTEARLDDDEYQENPYDPETDKIGSRLMKVISTTVGKQQPTDIEKGDGRFDKSEEGINLVKVVSNTTAKIERTVESELKGIRKSNKDDVNYRPGNFSSNKINIAPPAPAASPSASSKTNKLFKQFTFGGGGNNTKEIHRRLSEAKITSKAANMANNIAGIHVDTVDSKRHKMKRSNSGTSRRSSAVTLNTAPTDPKLGGKYATDRWKHFTYDYELDGERPVSFISENSAESGHSDLDN